MNNLDSKIIVEKGKKLYYSLKPTLKKKYKPDNYVCFEVETGDFFVGKTSIESLHKAKNKYPDRQFFLAQVGSLSGILK